MVVYIKKYIIIFLTIFLIIVLRIIYLNILNHDIYLNKLNDKTNIYIYGLSSPRGRILDVNGNVLVDNKKKRVIVYNKNKNISKDTEYFIASKLSKYISSDIKINNSQKLYYFINQINIFDYVDNSVYEKYLKNIISYEESYEIAKENILNNYSYKLDDIDDKTAKIYYLMNKDYLYDKKIIFDNLTDKEYFKILNENLPGISGEYVYERIYLYDDIMKSIYGSTGKISMDNKEEYLNKGYSLNDVVGTSYLEKEYEDILKGKKAKYILNNNGTLRLIEKEKQGKDLVLNIDINILTKLSEIIKNNMIKAKGKNNTEYFNETYALVGTPDGKVLAAVGYRFDEKNNLIDVSNNIISSAFVLGSVVKAASNSVGYHENVIDRDKKIYDSCVKLYLNKAKCSYTNLGLVDDISALEKSSNYYQFITAIKVMGYPKYSYNMTIDKNVNVAFSKYRSMFNNYGLGDYTMIDLPNEQTGITGSIISPDLLLNFSIGQYDAYTPVQALSYINTVASGGKRYNLSLNSQLNNYVINKIDIDNSDIKRIQTGLNNVIKKGTGMGYIYKNDGAGKTGTSETLFDKNNDGIYETKTISTAFLGYMPYDNPKYTFVLITPNISSNIKPGTYRVPINRYIIRELTQFLFEN